MDNSAYAYIDLLNESSGTTGSQTINGNLTVTGTITDTSLTPLQLVSTDASSTLISTLLQGTANQITVTGLGTATVTLATPQDIALTSSPTFVTLNATTSALIQTGSAKTFIGDVGFGMASFANNARATTSDYCLLQSSAGETFLNATTATAIHLRINNADKLTVINGQTTILNNLNLQSLTASLPLKLDASKNVISQLISLPSDVSGILPVINGGTGSTTALTGNKIMVSNAGGTAIIEGTSSINPSFTTLTTSGDITSTAGNVVLSNVNEVDIGTTRYLETVVLANTATLAFTNNGGNVQIGGSGGLTFLTVGAISATFNCPVEIGGPGFNRSLLLKNDNTPLVIGATNTITLKITSPAANRTYTIPDTLANSSFVMTDLAQTINGAKTFSAITTVSNGTASVSNTTGALVVTGGIGAQGNCVLGSGGSGAWIGDMGSGDASFSAAVNASTTNYALSQSTSGETYLNAYTGASVHIRNNNNEKLTISTGTTTSANPITITPTTNQIVLGVTNTTTITAPAPTSSRTVTLPDAGANSSFVLTELAQTINGAKTFGANATINTTLIGKVYNAVATVAGFQNSALAINTTNYGFIQDSTGNSFMNAPTGATANIRINDVTQWAVSSTALTATPAIVATTAGVKLGNYAQRTNNTAITCSNGAFTTLTWDTAVASNGITYSAGVFTCPLAGLYLVTFNIRWTNTSGITYDNGFFSQNSNDSYLHGINSIGGGAYVASSSFHYLPTANKTINCAAYQASGGSVTTVPGSANNNMVTIQLVSAL